MRVLVVTNGHGEDQLAVCLIKGLRTQWPELSIEAIPLVGQGQRLAAAGVAVDGPRVDVPSGGMVRPEAATVWRDVRAGLLGQFWRQRQFVGSRRNRVEAVLAVGDVLAGWTAGSALPGFPLILISTAKSEYISGHSSMEIMWMRRRAQHVFARDERTAAALRARGVAASWAGNLMMDALTITGQTFPPHVLQRDPDGDVRIVGFFPGSRQDAYVNLRSLAHVLFRLSQADGRYAGLVPLAPGLDLGRVQRTLSEDGWRGAIGPGRAADGRDEDRSSFHAKAGFERLLLQKGAARLLVVLNAFGDVLTASQVVVGLAGTANEQAAGLGKPVVAFPGPGVQFGPRFLRAQKRLLGDALVVAAPDPDDVAAWVARIFDDEPLRQRMVATGRERMGPPGAATRMAKAIRQLWAPARSPGAAP